MINSVVQFQIGKAGINEGVIHTISELLKSHKQVRISVLKSATRDRDEIKKMAEELNKKSEIPFDYKIIGFTIILRRRLSKMQK